MSQVEFKNVGKLYPGGVWAVQDFNLVIGDGEFVSFLGPSGCGKTTTLRMIAGLEKNTHGTLTLDNQVVSNPEAIVFMPPEKRHV